MVIKYKISGLEDSNFFEIPKKLLQKKIIKNKKKLKIR
jgi:hypothetical protein